MCCTKVEGALVDETRRESFVMAKELHSALAMGAEYVYGEELVVVPNTDLPDPGMRRVTIEQRVMSQITLIQKGWQKRQSVSSV